MKNFFTITFKIIVIIFACIGFVFTGVFVAMKLGLTKVGGGVDAQNSFWNEFNNRNSSTVTAPLGSWETTPEWGTLELAIVKDKPLIVQAATAAGIPPRLLVAQVVAEQLRLFVSERDVFKSVFQPLAILGTETQFSLGVTGVKEETALEIENYLNDPSSVFYPGDAYAHLLDYPAPPTPDQRIARLSDEHNHYYSYLYAALYLKEVMSQWTRAGFDISGRPEILSTLFNLGFEKSVPKADPMVGGAPIVINGTTYTFGGLAGEFYYSNELLADFPR